MSTLRANRFQAKSPASIQTPAVMSFCNTNGLSDYLTIAADLFRRHFELQSPFEWRLQEDMDSGDQYLELHALVGGGMTQVLEAYDKFTGEWIKQAPASARQRIRFTYSLA
jgi:hypothetical protein